MRSETAVGSTGSGFPLGFGRVGPGENDAALVLTGLRGSSPRALHTLAWRERTASACLDAIRDGRAGSDNDRAFVAAADPTEVRRALAAVDARFAVPGDPEYCPAFARLADPPVGVFVRGAPVAFGRERIAIVGSRTSSSTGRDVTKTLARTLALRGIVVVSGGALGIDAAAHQGALDASGRTVVVLGSGIDVLYPSTNRALFRRVLDAGGTLVSEYPPGTPAEPYRFPARNRLIAALSRGVVVVEGTAKSGTRITAEHALEIGLDVFAVPGSVTSPLAQTPLELIREGATLIRGADDLLADLGIDTDSIPVDAGDGLPDDERRVLHALIGPMVPEAVAKAASLSLADAVAALVRLELKGIVRGAGGRFEPTVLGARTGEG